MEIKEKYSEIGPEIKNRIKEFKSLNEREYFNEFIFCLLTPGSNAQRCWSAVQELGKLNFWSRKSVANVLKSRTRFHNNKAIRVLKSRKIWPEVKNKLGWNPVELRNWLADNVDGYGMKEASHFLRNIGKSDNRLAILDRHILKNLKHLGVIEEKSKEKIKNKAHYLLLEKQFLNFSRQINIPIDHLDLLFWSQENGEIFK